MTDTYPPLDGVPFKDGRYAFADGSAVRKSLYPAQWVALPLGREEPLKSETRGVTYSSPQAALAALRAEGYALPAEAAQPEQSPAAVILADGMKRIQEAYRESAAKPEPVKPKMPERDRKLREVFIRYSEFIGDAEREWLKEVEATYDVSEPPALPPKPAALEPFLIENPETGARAWANAFNLWGGGFIYMGSDGCGKQYHPADGWRRSEAQP